MPTPSSEPLPLQGEERRVDLLDKNAAVLNRLDAGGELDQLAGCSFAISIGRSVANLAMGRITALRSGELIYWG